MIYETAEVVDTKKAFKSEQKDDTGKKLPLGSIKVRLHNDRRVGNIDMFYARPLGALKHVPLIGEHVMVFKGPVGNLSDPQSLVHDWYYIPQPLNSNNDPTYNVLQHRFHRSKPGTPYSGPFIPKKPGYTFPFPPRPTNFMQFYEGDTLLQSRFNSSIRLSRTVKGDMSIYDERPTWDGGANGDPIMIFSIHNPLPGPKRLPPEYARDKTEHREIRRTKKYQVENLQRDLGSIYMTSKQKLPKVDLARTIPRPVRSIPRFSKPQILLDSKRIVLNAKGDDIYILAKKELFLSAKKIRLTTNKHDVDWDEFVDIVHDLVKEVKKLTTATAVFTTIVGPTGPATNAFQLIRLFLRVRRLKKFGFSFSLNLPPLPGIYQLGSDGIGNASESSNGGSSPGGGDTNPGAGAGPVDAGSAGGGSAGSAGGGSAGSAGGGANGSPTSAPNSPTSSPSCGGPFASSTPGSPLPPSPSSTPSSFDPSSPNLGNPPPSSLPVSGTYGGGTPYSSSYDDMMVSGSIPYDEIYISINSSFTSGSLEDGECEGWLYELKGRVSSVNEDNIFGDSVFMVKVDRGECGKGWYSIGSKKINKIIEAELDTLPKTKLAGYFPKMNLDGDCLTKIVYKPIYKECFYFVDYELIDLKKRVILKG